MRPRQERKFLSSIYSLKGLLTDSKKTSQHISENGPGLLNKPQELFTDQNGSRAQEKYFHFQNMSYTLSGEKMSGF